MYIYVAVQSRFLFKNSFYNKIFLDVYITQDRAVYVKKHRFLLKALPHGKFSPSTVFRCHDKLWFVSAVLYHDVLIQDIQLTIFSLWSTAGILNCGWISVCEFQLILSVVSCDIQIQNASLFQTMLLCQQVETVEWKETLCVISYCPVDNIPAAKVLGMPTRVLTLGTCQNSH